MHGVIVFRAQKWCAGHGAHVSFAKYQPGSQTHVLFVLPVADSVALGWQAEQEDAPVAAWKVFWGHSVQLLPVELPTTTENVPAAHGVQAPSWSNGL